MPLPESEPQPVASSIIGGVLNPMPNLPAPIETPPQPVIQIPQVRYEMPEIADIPAYAWQPAPQYSEGTIALTQWAADKGISIGGTSADGAESTGYWIDGKLVGVRRS